MIFVAEDLCCRILSQHLRAWNHLQAAVPRRLPVCPDQREYRRPSAERNPPEWRWIARIPRYEPSRNTSSGMVRTNRSQYLLRRIQKSDSEHAVGESGCDSAPFDAKRESSSRVCHQAPKNTLLPGRPVGITDRRLRSRPIFAVES